jgi:hypothetical protein
LSPFLRDDDFIKALNQGSVRILFDFSYSALDITLVQAVATVS